MSEGMLYLVATPIGNLEDITLRAIRVLGEVDVILCEDTRRTVKLLNHLDIKKPMISYHEHNKRMRDDEIIERIRGGETFALVSDAGMPCISDPGASVVKRAAEENIKVTIVPGACAAVSALAISGLDTDGFVFEGFLPEKGSELKKRLSSLAENQKTSILYESPHNLKRTMKNLHETLGDRRVAIVRELTKVHEEVMRCSLSEAVGYYEANEPRGEYVIVLEGKADEIKEFGREDIIKLLQKEIDGGLSKKEAVKKVAVNCDWKKSDVYSIAEECL